ncbi:MAG: tetratricopeptide repeat protein, partial [Planctomycetota bacterium]|jgi:protein O-GlcNAc transferase|nr:tetratricopeptide repeat protein [Planctomycetota bacterium]
MTDPESPDTNPLALAARALESGRLDEADGFFEQACAGSNPAEGFNGRGMTAAMRGDFSSASQHFQRAIDLEPANAVFRFQFGVSMLGQGRLEPATTAFEKAVELDAGFGQAWFNLGAARRQAGDGDGAIEAFRRSSEGDRGVPQGRLAIVETLRAGGAVEPAIAAAREAIAEKDDWAEAWGQLGLCLAAKQDIETALTCWERAVELEPKFLDARFHIGVAHGMLGRLDEAAAAYRTVLESAPGHVKSAVNLAGLLMHKGELDEAERRLVDATRVQSPERAMALTALGDLRMRQIKLAEAEQSFREACSLVPREPRPCIGLIACLLEQEKHGDALAEAERLSREHPDLPASAECLVEALIANGHAEQAMGVIDPCIARHGATPLRHGLKGRVCETMGDRDGALAAFEAALALDPNFTPAQQGKARLA